LMLCWEYVFKSCLALKEYWCSIYRLSKPRLDSLYVMRILKKFVNWCWN